MNFAKFLRTKNTFSNRTPPVAASERWKIVKPITLQINFFTEVTGNKGLSINTCFVDVGAIKNASLK